MDRADAERPLGWTLSTEQQTLVTLTGGENRDDVDFGFSPILAVDKALVGADPIYEGDLVDYTIDVTNLLSSFTPSVITPSTVLDMVTV